MDRICSQCHAQFADETKADWCPACGGALVDRPALDTSGISAADTAAIDHRGIVLPRRHALGGVITPQ